MLVGALQSLRTSGGKAQWRKILGKRLIHPKYKLGYSFLVPVVYDFMLFKIEPVTLDNLKPIPLNTHSDLPTDGQVATVLGFGSTFRNNTRAQSERLLKAK